MPSDTLTHNFFFRFQVSVAHTTDPAIRKSKRNSRVKKGIENYKPSTKKRQQKNTDDFIGFAEAKESYNKKPHNKDFTYFQGKQLGKVSKKLVLSKSVIKNAPSEVFQNGLWQDVELYRNLTIKFILCRKDGLALTNESFDGLNPQRTISEPLMKYLLHSLPSNTIVSENGTVNWEFGQGTTNEFVTICCSEAGWALFVINHKDKTFGVINRNILSTHLAEKFISTLQSENYIDMDLQDVPDKEFNSGVFIHKFIVTFIATGSTIREDFCANSYREELQKQLIEESDDVRDFCPMCNLSDIDGKPMVECTLCLRWSHCCCINVTIEDVRKDKDFRCPVCDSIQF